MLDSVAASAHNVQLVSACLHDNIPSRASFKVINIAKHPGFYMGPRAGDIQWQEPLRNFQLRVDNISAKGRHSGKAAAVPFHPAV